MDNPKVYSYLRFSDPKQAAGSSADRQTAYAQRWAADRGMVLDEALSLRDEGLSAYHQRHITQGALGAFLRADWRTKMTKVNVQLGDKSLVSTYSTIRAVQNQQLGAVMSVQKRQRCAQNSLALAQNLHKKRTGKTTTESG